MTLEAPSHQQWLRDSFVQVTRFEGLNMLVLKRTLKKLPSLKTVNQFVILMIISQYIIFCSTFCTTNIVVYLSCMFCFVELSGLNISSSKDKEKESTRDT
jgi:hypothetical protein